MIVRADDGGLGVQTWEIARHLRPARALVVRVDPPRGAFLPERFDGICGRGRIAPNPPTDEDLRWLFASDTTEVLTVEGCYNDRLIDIAAEHPEARLTVYANPELFPDRYRPPAEAGALRVLLPTEWEAHRLPFAQHLPMPVATDRCRGRIRARQARRFLHISAPAMLDRNGTELVMAAARAYRGPNVTLLVAGPQAPPHPQQAGPHVVVEPLPDVVNYWERYTPDLDALIQPRRYGGLSLVSQEARAAGLPIICLDRHPENTWLGARRVPVTGEAEHRMKGGHFAVATTSDELLAQVWADHACTDPFSYSGAAKRDADRLAWHTLLPVWQQAFGQA